MRKWLFRIIWIPALIVGVLFLVANRQPVSISLDPFSASNPAVTTTALPLWFWLVAMLFLGVGFGSLGMWLSGAGRRRKLRNQKRELKSLRKDLAAARADGVKASPSTSLQPSADTEMQTQQTVSAPEQNAASTS